MRLSEMLGPFQERELTSFLTALLFALAPFAAQVQSPRADSRGSSGTQRRRWLPQALNPLSSIATSGTPTRAGAPPQDRVLLAARPDQPLPRFRERSHVHPQAVQPPQQICDPPAILPAPAGTLFGSINSIAGPAQRCISLVGKLSW